MSIRGLTIVFAFLILLLISNAIIASAAPPNIVSSSPDEIVVNNTIGAKRGFEIKINQTVNVSWLINGTIVQTNETVTNASYINKSAVEGNWNITAVAENQNGTDTRTWNWRVTKPAPPNIVSWSPDEIVVNNTVGAERGFEIKINQTVNVSWLINGTVVLQTNETVTNASYINKSAVEGNWNITAVAENQNGTGTRTWNWSVTKPSIMSTIKFALSKPIFPLWFLIVLVIVFSALFFFILRAQPTISGEYKSLKNKNKELRREIGEREDMIAKAEKEIRRMRNKYGVYERNKDRIKNFREKSSKELEEIRRIGEKIKEKAIEDVADFNIDPFKEGEGEALGTALMEYMKLIFSIKKAMEEKEQIYEEERMKSNELIGKLEKEGIDTEIYKKLLEDSNADGLKVLHGSLNYINNRLGEKEFNPATIKRLKETREKINKMMVDWGIKIVPSKLLDFCEKLIKETSLPEEVYPSEKTVETIIDLINEVYVRK